MRKFTAFYLKRKMVGEKIEESFVPVFSALAHCLEDFFVIMQGEIWSPNGEARRAIAANGLSHTSMKSFDVIGEVELAEDDLGLVTYTLHEVACVGFNKLGSAVFGDAIISTDGSGTTMRPIFVVPDTEFPMRVEVY